MPFEWQYLEKKNLQKYKWVCFLIFSQLAIFFLSFFKVLFCSHNSHEGVKCKKKKISFVKIPEKGSYYLLRVLALTSRKVTKTK